MKILVTGCAGFVARHMIPALGARGASVVGIDVQPTEADFGDFFKGVTGDVADFASTAGLLSGVDAVVHLAAEHKDFGISEDLYHQVNVDGTQVLLDAAAENGVRDFVFYSSVAVYGDIARPRTEEATPEPASPYGRSKLAAEQRVHEWSRNEKRRSLVIRPAVIHGAHNYANMYRLMTQISRRRFLQIGKGGNVKSIGYVENLVDATLFLMDHMEPGTSTFNFADEPQLTTRQIAETLADTLGTPLPRWRLPKALSLAATFPLDVAAAVTGRDLPITAHRIHKFTTTTRFPADKLLAAGFTPRFSSVEGLQKTAEWFGSL